MTDDVKDAADKAVGACQESYVVLEHTTAIVCLVLNCIPGLAGLGTMISACVGDQFNCNALVFGLLQWILEFILVGYIWSIIHGIKLLDISKK